MDVQLIDRCNPRLDVDDSISVMSMVRHSNASLVCVKLCWRHSVDPDEQHPPPFHLTYREVKVSIIESVEGSRLLAIVEG